MSITNQPCRLTFYKITRDRNNQNILAQADLLLIPRLVGFPRVSIGTLSGISSCDLLFPVIFERGTMIDEGKRIGYQD